MTQRQRQSKPKLLILVAGLVASTSHAFSPPVMSNTAMLQSIADFYEQQPGEAAMVTCAVKASCADLVAQVRQNLSSARLQQEQEEPSSETSSNNNKLDFDRTLSFILYGAFYQGLAQHFIYNHLFTEWFGDGRAPLIVATKVLCDMALVSPHLPMPLSYSIKSIVSGQSITEGLQKYYHSVIHQNLLFKYWAFWMPVQVVNFSCIPEAYRILFMAAFSFVWTIILSSTMNASSSEEEDAVVATIQQQETEETVLSLLENLQPVLPSTTETVAAK
mmetsp:Transcript_17892/g.26469  ORF Transcript_17892/g.26469 Transcript_17892/m.26469 type:complete len:275 (-) Transcript_17892:131-955(-)|eukprot:CAMPEP_0194199442 /NCGR_PEP_ID=MMETSP0156-20130528/458_1 /TAXON_ID=33649 /ORGANISM="Thalassionema nitzschioides, Strain L26-B" /LENGTH=274 /DNA_ID=CAMNT_0038924335 /DNA_START=139 /DNA_END=963 /DNA_ORIENTATION=-